MWRLSHRFDRAALPLADAHYNRQKPGSPQFVPPGRCVVLLAGEPAHALWVTSWPFARYTKHKWAGAWVCSCFRRTGGGDTASSMIIGAVAATRAIFGDPPPLGMVTFIDRDHVRPTMVRGAKVWGWTYLRAGWEVAGETQGGLLCLRLAPDRMPVAAAPVGMQGRIFGAGVTLG